MNRKDKQLIEDDGRTIMNMDVDGMPWHDKRVKRERVAAQKHSQGIQMTRTESRLHTWYSLLYAMLIATVFSGTWILFTLFCTQIWFK